MKHPLPQMFPSLLLRFHPLLLLSLSQLLCRLHHLPPLRSLSASVISSIPTPTPLKSLMAPPPSLKPVKNNSITPPSSLDSVAPSST
ncbi:hypothetical protein BC829DRAFT_398384 [Chytridium lagenaria]|nr:hypothetical protein BC829DRAFT_398384 [Chytridium lagenaria]